MLRWRRASRGQIQQADRGWRGGRPGVLLPLLLVMVVVLLRQLLLLLLQRRGPEPHLVYRCLPVSEARQLMPLERGQAGRLDRCPGHVRVMMLLLVIAAACAGHHCVCCVCGEGVVRRSNEMVGEISDSGRDLGLGDPPRESRLENLCRT